MSNDSEISTGGTTTAGLRIEILHDSAVNYAMQQNCVPVVKRLRLVNDGGSPFGPITVRITAEPGFTKPWTSTVASIQAGQAVDLGLVDLELSPTFLSGLAERVQGVLSVTVDQGEHPETGTDDARELASLRSPIAVLAADEWSGARSIPEMLAAFVRPNEPAVTRVLTTASTFLESSTGSPALDAYQSRDPSRVLAQARAIYEALQSHEIAYCVPPASFETEGQKIRPAESILENKLGTCLDLAVLYAACLESAGLHPLVAMTDGHAFTGVWLIREFFAAAVLDDVTELTLRIAPGVNEIALIEATSLCAGANVSFDAAQDSALQHLAEPGKFLYLVDIRRARAGRILPLAAIRPDSGRTDGVTAASAPRTAVGSGAPLPEWNRTFLEPETSEARTRLDRWERLLLDLSLRNPLVNFRSTAANVRVLSHDLPTLEDVLEKGKDLQLIPRPADWDNTPNDPAVYAARTRSDPRTELLGEQFAQGR
ncbi:MAG: DUF4011 domain-containing protein, partial [Capsulimonadaceae bacterium]